MIVKDSMVLIHLAKTTLLKKSCEFFEKVMIPKMVHDEVMVGQEKGYVEAKVIADLVNTNKIIVKQIKNAVQIKKAEEFNIKRGEAEAVALYWEEKADYLATDDDSVRKKSIMLDLQIIGTPAIIVKLYREKLIDKRKFEQSLIELKKIGWFSNALIDGIFVEVSKWEKQ